MKTDDPTKPTAAKPTGALLGDAVHYLTRLVRGEVALAKAEVEDNLRAAVTGIVLVVAAVVIALSALNVLSAALVTALVEMGLSPVWAALAVALLLCVFALIFGWLGVSALKPRNLIPSQSVENVRRDAQAIKEIVEDDPSH